MKRPPYAKLKPDLIKKRVTAFEKFKAGKFKTLTDAAKSCDCNYDQFRKWLKINNYI